MVWSRQRRFMSLLGSFACRFHENITMADNVMPSTLHLQGIPGHPTGYVWTSSEIRFCGVNSFSRFGLHHCVFVSCISFCTAMVLCTRGRYRLCDDLTATIHM
ncbi:hypothetical protein F5I97DRAFT_276599 [Phlebopus sp. FC_14]|nr:hypothetical protein F5I97DRAFT_276599 [Phlebopus sp. FC_14]